VEINKIYQGNCLDIMKLFEDNSIDCCITSPPYWGLRDYGTAKWEGGDVNCNHESARIKTRFDYELSDKQKGNKGTDVKIYKDTCECGATKTDEQLGSEKHFKDFVNNLCNVFDEIKRVLKDTGTCFVNLGDTYATDFKGGQKANPGDKSFYKNGTGQYGRIKLNTEITQKCLMMIPERFALQMIDTGWILRNQIIWHKPNQMPSSATDRFTVDFEKIFFFVKKPMGYYFEQQLEKSIWAEFDKRSEVKGGVKSNGKTATGNYATNKVAYTEGGMRNVRTTWSVNTEPNSEAHFATYPQRLVERMIKAGCPENGLVIDPFFGSGTTGIYALKAGRKYVGIELNPEYVKIAEKRLYKEIGMFL